MCGSWFISGTNTSDSNGFENEVQRYETMMVNCAHSTTCQQCYRSYLLALATPKYRNEHQWFPIENKRYSERREDLKRTLIGLNRGWIALVHHFRWRRIVVIQARLPIGLHTNFQSGSDRLAFSDRWRLHVSGISRILIVRTHEYYDIYVPYLQASSLMSASQF